MIGLMTRGGQLLILGACALAASLASPARAEYKLTEIDFDMWCQEEQHLAPERCDQRLPEDEKAFEAYIDTIQKYEIPYLKERDKREQYNRTLLHNDPVDDPTEPSTPPLQPINSAPPK